MNIQVWAPFLFWRPAKQFCQLQPAETEQDELPPLHSSLYAKLSEAAAGQVVPTAYFPKYLNIPLKKRTLPIHSVLLETSDNYETKLWERRDQMGSRELFGRQTETSINVKNIQVNDM